MSAIQETLSRAIALRKRVELRYGEHRRSGEPHVLGVCNGVLQLLLYQDGGESRSGSLPQWRRFNVSDIEDLVVTSQSFEPGRQGATGRHQHWDERIAYVPAKE